MPEVYAVEKRTSSTNSKPRCTVHIFPSRKYRDLWIERAAELRHSSLSNESVVREAISKSEVNRYSNGGNPVRHSYTK